MYYLDIYFKKELREQSDAVINNLFYTVGSSTTTAVMGLVDFCEVFRMFGKKRWKKCRLIIYCHVEAVMPSGFLQLLNCLNRSENAAISTQLQSCKENPLQQPKKWQTLFQHCCCYSCPVHTEQMLHYLQEPLYIDEVWN